VVEVQQAQEDSQVERAALEEAQAVAVALQVQVDQQPKVLVAAELDTATQVDQIQIRLHIQDLVVAVLVDQDLSVVTADKHLEDQVVRIQFQVHLWHTQVAVEAAVAFHHQHEAEMV